MTQMIFKTKDKSVNIQTLEEPLVHMLSPIAEECRKWNGNEYVMTITSGNDGKHIKNSLHYKNKAIDIRSKDMRMKEYTVYKLKKMLGNSYDILLESHNQPNEHIHIEYDPK